MMEDEKIVKEWFEEDMIIFEIKVFLVTCWNAISQSLQGPACADKARKQLKQLILAIQNIDENCWPEVGDLVKKGM